MDETENEEYFIVAGLLADSEETVNLSYKQFKNSIKGFKISEKSKSKLYTEFKSILMDTRFQRIKVNMLEKINDMDAKVIYSCYKKRRNPLNQALKESIYITLLNSIIDTITDEIDVIFDRFGIDEFEKAIVRSVTGEHVISVRAQDSQIKEGLQFIDNICSSIRLHISGRDTYGFYDIIQSKVTVI